jgi:hypothetical protein
MSADCGLRIFQNETPHVVSYGEMGHSGFREKRAMPNLNMNWVLRSILASLESERIMQKQ